MVLLPPGNNNNGDNWGCIAFQIHRHPASTTRGYPGSDGSKFDQGVSGRKLLNDFIGGATPNTNYVRPKANKQLNLFSWMAASAKGNDDGGDDDDEIAEIEAKRASAEAEANRLKAEADKAAKLKAQQEAKLKEAEEMMALLQKAAKQQAEAEKVAAKRQAEAEEKRKQAEEEAAKLKAAAEAKKEEKKKLKAQKKAEELATLLKAKEEAARVMAEIDAKLQAETAEADQEEAERVEKLQSDAAKMPVLDDEDDETLKQMMEEMEKVRIELDKRVKEEAEQEKARIKKAEEKAAGEAESKEEVKKKEAEEAVAKAKAENEAKIKKEEEEAAAKAKAEEQVRVKKAAEEAATAKVKAKAEEEARLKKEKEEAAAKAKAEEEAKMKNEEAAKAEAEEQAQKKKEEEEAAAKAKAEEQAKANLEDEASDSTDDLMERITKGSSFESKPKEVSAEPVTVEPVKEKSTPFFSSPKAVIDTTATSEAPREAPRKRIPMPDVSSSSKKKSVAKKKKPEAKKKTRKEKSKPKWMVDWKEDENDDAPKAKDVEKKEASKPPKDTVETKDEKAVEGVAEKEKEKAEEEQEEKNSDPRIKGRSRKENLFDVIGRTASGGVTMDDITKRKISPKKPPPPPPPEVLEDLRKKGPPESFGESVAESYRTGKTKSEKQKRVMPELTNMKELKKKGPPVSFGSFAKAASTSGSPSITDSDGEKDTIDTMDKGPPASFGVSVAMASSGEVPKDLLKRGTASTDVGTSSPPKQPSSPSRKKGSDNIIDVVDAVYTKKDNFTKAEPVENKAAPSRPVGSAPPLQVEKTVAPMTNPPKKEDASTDNPIKNIGKAAVDKVFGQKNKEAKIDAEAKETKEVSEDKKEKAKEDRVADLLKEAFSLSKEDSRVADLLKGVVAITTGKDKKKKKKKEGKGSVEKPSAKGRKRARIVAMGEENDDEEDEEEFDDIDDDEDDEDDFGDEDEDDFDDDFDDENDYDDEEEEEEDDNVIMGNRNVGRDGRIDDGRMNRGRMDGGNSFGRNANRRGPPGMGPGRMGGDRYRVDPRPYGDTDSGGFFVDGDDEYFEYDEFDRFRGRGPGSRRPEPTNGSDGYSVRPPPQSRGQQRPDDDDDYYFLQFGSPSSRYDEPRDNYYDEDHAFDDDDYDGPQPGMPRPASFEDDSPKGPPSTFGNFVADASMSKTGYAPTTMKDEKTGGSGVNGNSGDGDEWGEEMSYDTGSMMSPRGVNGSGRASSKGRSRKDPFVVSEEQSGGGGGRKKGPPSSFGKSVAAAGEQQTGMPSSRSIEEEIANGGMATPTGSMATPKRKTPVNGGSGKPVTPPVSPTGGAGQGTPKKPLFIVSEDESGEPGGADFGDSVAEASGARTGWAPSTPKRQTGGLDGGTTGGMRPKIKKQSNTQSSTPQKKEFGSSVFDDCPPLESTKKKNVEANKPLQRKPSLDGDLNQKHQRNPAVNLVDGGASKTPKRVVQYGGSMMAPRIRRQVTPEQPVTPPTDTEGENPEEGKKK